MTFAKAGLSVVVIGWNGASDVERCLEALLAEAPARERPFEVHFVDNGSADASVAIARRFEPRVQVHALGENRGFSGAANAGAARTRLDYILFINPDVTARRGAVETLAAFLDDHPEAAAVTGKLVDSSGAPQRGFNVRRLPTVGAQAAELLLLHRLWPRNPVTRRHRMLDFDYESVAEVEQPAGACFAVRRETFLELDGFDEQFQPAWFEDVDLCKRLHDRGRRIFFVPGAIFEHRGGASLDHLSRAEFVSIWYRNMLRYFEKHERRRVGPLRWLVGVGLLGRMVLSVHRPRRCKAYWRGVRNVS